MNLRSCGLLLLALGVEAGCSCEDDPVPASCPLPDSGLVRALPDAESEQDGNADPDSGADTSTPPPSTDSGDETADDAGDDVGDEADASSEDGSDPAETDGSDADSAPPAPDGSDDADGAVTNPTLVPVAVDTIAPTSARAGQPLFTLCLLVDASQNRFVAPNALPILLTFAPADAVTTGAEGAITPVRAGELRVTCGVPSLALEDATPALVAVLPGSPSRVVASLDKSAITAGESFGVSCQVFDAWDNPVTGLLPTPRSDPAHERNTFQQSQGTFEHAGSFAIHCDLAGTTSVPAALEVAPGLPASLAIARVPDLPTYALSQIVEIRREVTDRFGNPVPTAVVPVTSEPAGKQVSDGRFRYSTPGEYRLTATVAPPTEGDSVLSQFTDVLVDGSGPTLGCDAPFDSGMVDASPGQTILFRGTASDPSGVKELRVNGAVVPVDAAGRFAAELTTRFGINFVDLVAFDSAMRETGRTCAFLVANEWAPDESALSDVVSLRLGSAAIDDGARSDLDSMADLLESVLSSSAPRDAIHAEMSSRPVIKSGCDQMVLEQCILESEIRYVDTRIDGPQGASLGLVKDGLAGVFTLRNVGVSISLSAEALGVPYQKTGWFTCDSIEVSTVFDITLQGGRPRASVRPGSTSTTVGAIGTDFSGVDGQLLEIVVQYLGDILREVVAARIQSWVTSDLGTVLDGIVGGLDVSRLGRTLQVPHPGTGALIPFTLGVSFSSLSTDPLRMLFGMGTRLSAPIAHARSTLGAPVRHRLRLLDIVGGEPAGVAVHEAMLGQSLHALWRAGFFDATLDAAALGADPATGIEAVTSTELPPAVEIVADRVQFSLGGVKVELAVPGFLAQPIPITVGARVSALVGLAGESLIFQDLATDELHVSTEAAPLDPTTRGIVEDIVTGQIETLVGTALQDALPSVPLPTFVIPASLAAYGLPAGSALGMTTPALTTETPHLVLRGGFGVR